MEILIDPIHKHSCVYREIYRPFGAKLTNKKENKYIFFYKRF